MLQIQTITTQQALFNAGLYWLICGVHATVACGDGGQLRLVEQQHGYKISVFTSSNPLRAGTVDISVLLQRDDTEEPVTAGEILVRLTPQKHPDQSVTVTATTAAATNKLLRAAVFDLPSPGRWDVEIQGQIEHSTIQVRFAMDVASPLPDWLTAWPAFTWPIGAILLFIVHRILVHRQHSRRREKRTVSNAGRPQHELQRPLT